MYVWFIDSWFYKSNTIWRKKRLSQKVFKYLSFESNSSEHVWLFGYYSVEQLKIKVNFNNEFFCFVYLVEISESLMKLFFYSHIL